MSPKERQKKYVWQISSNFLPVAIRDFWICEENILNYKNSLSRWMFFLRNHNIIYSKWVLHLMQLNKNEMLNLLAQFQSLNIEVYSKVRVIRRPELYFQLIIWKENIMTAFGWQKQFDKGREHCFIQLFCMFFSEKKTLQAALTYVLGNCNLISHIRYLSIGA